MGEQRSRAISPQAPRLAYVVHAVPGDVIDVCVMVDGVTHKVPISDRYALDMAADLMRAVTGNMGNSDRRALCDHPRRGNRG